jgi:hypothetical protein
MIISHKHKFIYVKATKVAGTSAEYFLERICGEDDIITPIEPVESELHSPRNYKQHGIHNHLALSDLFQKIPSELFKDYRIVVNERNTWARVASFYNMWVSRKFSKIVLPFKPFIKEKHIGSVCDAATHQGEILVTDWIRFSHLHSDLIKFCEALNVDCKNIPCLHTKNYPRKHYTEYYDDETREIVAEKYAKDIEYFGYKFGE